MARKVDNPTQTFTAEKDIVDSLRHQLMLSNDIIKSLKDETLRREQENSKMLSEKDKVIKNLEKSIASLKKIVNQKNSLLLQVEKKHSLELQKTYEREQQILKLKTDLAASNQMFSDVNKEFDLVRKHLAALEKANESLVDKREVYMQNLTILKTSLDSADALSKKEKKVFDDAIKSLRKENKIKLSDITTQSTKMQVDLKSHIFELEKDLQKHKDLLQQKEEREKLLLSDFNEKFRGLMLAKEPTHHTRTPKKHLIKQKPQSTIKQNIHSEDELRMLKPMVETALAHGESIDHIEHSLASVGYSEENIKKVINGLRY